MSVERRGSVRTSLACAQLITDQEEAVTKTKPFTIDKWQVVRAYELVKANAGAAGIDQQSIADFDKNRKNNLYKLWNRLSSGSYCPAPVKAVAIPKKSGGKRYDYFTSSLPFPQKGPDVLIPLGSTAPVVSTGVVPFMRSVTTLPTTDRSLQVGTDSKLGISGTIPSLQQVVFGSVTGLETDLTDATAATINDIRLAFQTQKLYERDARGGTRYTEIIKSHFGVTSPDMRLQRPEYLGGGSTPVIINPIAQTFSMEGSKPLGELAAYGVCVPEGHGSTICPFT